MANEFVQTMADARVDAQSLSDFVFKPSGFKVARRLAPTIDTLQFYINRFDALDGDFSSSVSVALSSLNSSVAEADGKVAYIETTVQDAINNTAIEGGVLADTFVVVDATLNQRQINRGFESIADMLSIANPNNGLRVYVKSYFPNLGTGGGWFIYDSSKVSTNDGGIVFNGWVRENTGGDIKPAWFGVRTDGTDDPLNPNHELLQIAVDLGFRTFDFGDARNSYLFNGQVGLQRQDIYTGVLYSIIATGAKVKLEGTHAWLTSKTAKDAGGVGTGNIYTGKVSIRGFNFSGKVRDGIFDGDYIYNLMFTGNNCDGMDMISKSYKDKGASYTTGYFQSVFLINNYFNQCKQILLGSAAFNTTFNQNICENCSAGLYIFGAGQPALANIRIRDNLFEGGGLFLKLSDTLSGVISGNYLEANTLTDVISEQCLMLFTRAGGSSLMNYEVSNNSLGVTVAQINDVDFQAIKFVGFPFQSLNNITLNNNWTGGILTKASISNAVGNVYKSSTDIHTTAGAAGVSYVSLNTYKDFSTVLSDGSLEVLSFTLPPNDTSYKDVKLNVVIKGTALTVNSLDLTRFCITFDIFIFNRLRGGGGRKPPELGVVLGELSTLQQPSDMEIDTVSKEGSATVFTAPTLLIVSDGNTHKVLVSGATAPTSPTYGKATKLEFTTTVTSYNHNPRYNKNSSYIVYQ